MRLTSALLRECMLVAEVAVQVPAAVQLSSWLPLLVVSLRGYALPGPLTADMSKRGCCQK